MRIFNNTHTIFKVFSRLNFSILYYKLSFNKSYIFCFVILILPIFSSLSLAQNEKLITHQPQFWSEGNFFERWSRKWATQVDIQYARQGSEDELNMFKYQQQLTIRAWGHYYFWNKNERKFRVSAFIGNWDNHKIPELDIKRVNEYRAAIQLNVFNKTENPLIVNRLRIEYRLYEKTAGSPSEGFNEAYRLRYQTRVYKPLNQSTLDSGALYFMGFQETFLFIYDQRGRISLYDQNRLFLGLGYVFSPYFAIEAGYFGMFQMNRTKHIYDMNHIFQVSLYFDNLISRKLKNKIYRTQKRYHTNNNNHFFLDN